MDQSDASQAKWSAVQSFLHWFNLNHSKKCLSIQHNREAAERNLFQFDFLGINGYPLAPKEMPFKIHLSLEHKTQKHKLSKSSCLTSMIGWMMYFNLSSLHFVAGIPTVPLEKEVSTPGPYIPRGGRNTSKFILAFPMKQINLLRWAKDPVLRSVPSGENIYLN